MPVKKNPYLIGDIFGIPMPQGLWCVGRVVFDPLKQLLEPKVRTSAHSQLAWRESAVLIDLFDGLHPSPAPIDGPLLVHGLFVEKRSFEQGLWPIIGHAPIDPTKVEFPESLLSEGPTVYFRKGELDLKTKLSKSVSNEIDCRPTTENSYALPRILLTRLGRLDLAESPMNPYDLRYSDLRFHPRRAEVYAYLDIDPDAAYYPTALARGFDLARLYP